MQTRTLLLIGLSSMLVACADPGAQKQEPRYTIVRPAEQTAKAAGISPEKEAEIQLVLQQRDTTTRRCYQDALNEKADRNFAGNVMLVITVQPSGQASDVKVAGGTLTDKGVHDCLIEAIKGFEFPQISTAGDVQYEYRFRPAY